MELSEQVLRVRSQKLKWYRANRAVSLKRMKEWAKKNRKHLREKARLRWHLQTKVDVRKKLVHYARVRIGRILKGRIKSGATLVLLGTTPAGLKIHLENTFKPGMTWENYGTYWQVDHKRPLASFDLTDPAQQRQACHYSNLQALTVQENLDKRDKW